MRIFFFNSDRKSFLFVSFFPLLSLLDPRSLHTYPKALFFLGWCAETCALQTVTQTDIMHQIWGNLFVPQTQLFEFFLMSAAQSVSSPSRNKKKKHVKTALAAKSKSDDDTSFSLSCVRLGLVFRYILVICEHHSRN